MNGQEPEALTPRALVGLVVLILIGILSFIDRQILVILIEPIKADLHLSDGQVGLLTGMAFASVYLVASFPLASWADRADRSKVLAICVSLWSVMTALSGAAQVFWQLCLARAGVAAGEATVNPSSQSLVADTIPAAYRGRAMAALTIGPALGIFAGLFLGGWIATHWNWRVAFVAVGAPGLFLALASLLFIHDPRKTQSDARKRGQMLAGIQDLWSNKGFRLAMIGLGFHSFSSYGWTTWSPSFLVRVHDAKISDIGLWLGLSTAVGALGGNFLGGAIVDRLGVRDPRWFGFCPAIGSFSAILFAALFVLVPGQGLAILLFLPLMLTLATWGAPTYALAQKVATGGNRALSAAIVGFFSNFIGTGLGPLAVGLSNDFLAPTYGAEAIRWSLLFTLPSLLIGAWFYYRAGLVLGRETDVGRIVSPA